MRVEMRLGDEVRTPVGNCIIVGIAGQYRDVMDIDKKTHTFHMKACLPIKSALRYNNHLTTWDEVNAVDRSKILQSIHLDSKMAEYEWDELPDEVAKALIRKLGFPTVKIPVPPQLREGIKIAKKKSKSRDFRISVKSGLSVKRYCKDCGDVMANVVAESEHVEKTNHTIVDYQKTNLAI